MHFEDLRGPVKQKVKIQEGFAQLSLCRQLESLGLTDEIWTGTFQCLFVGAGCEKFTWSREPSSWWGARKCLFATGRGELVEALKKTVRGIKESVEMWRDEVGEIERDVLSLKRQRSIFTDEPAVEKADAGMLMPADKKPKIPGRESEEVMSGAWRARRRL